MSQRPRIVAPIYGSADHVRRVSGLATAPGPPVISLVSSEAGNLGPPILYSNGDETTRPLVRTPSPLLHDPALISDRQLQQDYSFDDQIERLEMEVEIKREQNRVVPGIDTKDFHAMLRSFGKQVQHVKLCAPPNDGHIPTGLDLHPDPDEEVSVVKVRNSLERFYTTVGMGLLRVGRELQRIYNWEDGTRSTIAAAIYTYAWWCEMIIPAILVSVSILVLIPSSRRFFFESAAHRRVRQDGKAVQKIVDERAQDPWGPAATEESATHWAEGVQDLVTSLAAGQTTKEEKDARQTVKTNFDEKLDEDKGKLKDAGQGDEKDDDRSRKDLAVRMYAQPTMRVVAGIADKWERMEHVLEPKGRLHQHRRYAVFLQLLLPALLGSIFVSERMMSRAIGLIFGLALFTQPLLMHIIDELDRSIPDWKSKMILELNIFETTPTNAQVVLAILRDAEHRKNPLAPAPHPDDDEKAMKSDDGSDNEPEDKDSIKMDTSSAGSKEKRENLVDKLSHAGQKGKHGTKVKARKAWDRLGKAKEEGFAIIAGHKQLDVQGKAEHLLDKLHISKEHKIISKALDHMPSPLPTVHGDSASTFYVWHKHHGPGHVIVHPHDPFKGLPARIEFTTVKKVKGRETTDIDADPEAFNGNLVAPIDDIVALKKVGMSAVKSTALSWALDSEGAGGTGLEVTVNRRLAQPDTPIDHSLEQVIPLRSIVRRDELFNRLIAMGEQRWQML